MSTPTPSTTTTSTTTSTTTASTTSNSISWLERGWLGYHAFVHTGVGLANAIAPFEIMQTRIERNGGGSLQTLFASAMKEVESAERSPLSSPSPSQPSPPLLLLIRPMRLQLETWRLPQRQILTELLWRRKTWIHWLPLLPRPSSKSNTQLPPTPSLLTWLSLDCVLTRLLNVV
ncbi:hypothetical protein BCR33DRAFT_236079 [Rhizoclosmatium globosum]|uniref:Mitochondrial carrier n=1 Tax=Rhizoclosmatium globosum TaxID=329046 RepID=A0A1Y2CB24_9FUNG|nr:hypothetical protein BCR33DRAFT_236079 [Rhizoclosmatium globosum]|eukprot:ORY44136.1 hypothetical protein BCR33DRAFT_236079 [Rhizoclosmatium globosum]